MNCRCIMLQLLCFIFGSAELSAQISITQSPKNNAAAPLAVTGVVFTTPENMSVSDKNGIHFMSIPENVTSIEEKELAFNATFRAPRDPSGDQSNGVRFYAFILNPKESLALQLEAENPNHVGMKFLQPSKPDGMRSQYMRLDNMAETLRCSRQDIRNVTSESYKVVLMVYGRMQHWFKVRITRSM